MTEPMKLESVAAYDVPPAQSNVGTGKPITEKSGEHQQWYVDAKEQTLATLPEFLRHLTQDYAHDYGTICHAVAAGAVAAAWAVNHEPCGGITGFQADAIMLEFIKHWMRIEGPARLVQYDEMLYPHYAEEFAQFISSDTWEWLKVKAKNELAADHKHVHPDVVAHWESIVAGRVPFGYAVVP